MINTEFKEYAAASSMLGALRGKGLDERILRQLLETENLSTCFEILDQHPLLPSWSNDKEYIPLHFEHRLHTYLIQCGNKLLRFLPQEQRDIITLFFARYDFHNIKLLFRRFIYSLPGKDNILFYHSFYIKQEGIAQIKQLKAIREAFHHTPLDILVHQAFEVCENKKLNFYFDLVLDTGYNQLWGKVLDEKLPGEAEEIKKRLLIPYLGTKSLLWALRLRFYYKMSGEEIFPYMVTHADFFSPESYWHLVEMERIDEIAEAVLSSLPPDWQKQFPEEIEDISGCSTVLWKLLWQRIKQSKTANPFRLVNFLSFLFRQLFLINDIIIILQGIKYGLKGNEIEQKLICL